MRPLRTALLATLIAAAGLGLAVTAARCQPPPEPPGGAAGAGVDWNIDIGNLEQTVDAAAAAAAERGVAADVLDSNLPLARLELEKMQLRLASRWRDTWWTTAQEESRAQIEAAVERLSNGTVAHEGQTGADSDTGYFERAYLARNDRSPQPYFVRLPDGYDPAKPWPMAVFLHGYVPETSKVDPWVLPGNIWDMAAAKGLILVMPHGRRNSDFLGVGETDVLRVIEEMQRWYNVDPDRVHMTGCSMGGYGGWAIGLRHPDRFASLGLMSGQTDFFLWERRPRDATAYKSWCILQNNPLDLAANAMHLPMYLQHGAEDPLVPVAHSRAIVPLLEQFGYDIRYDELAGQGHYIYWETEPFARLFDFIQPLKRVRDPRRVVFTTYTPEAGRAYWLDIRRLQQWGPPAEVEASVDGATVAIRQSNVAELWVDLPESLLPGEAELRINGEAAGRIAAGPHRITLDTEAPVVERAAPPAGRPRTGPMREAFDGPFLVVQATGGDDATRRHNEARAERFRQVWYAFAEGLVPLRTDESLTAEEVAQHNLIIFGEPSTTRLAGLPDPATALPAGVTMLPGRYAAGEHQYEGDYGMILRVPHPLNAQRHLVWLSGAEYGEGLPINHQFDLIPDLLIYSDGTDWDGTDPYQVGGFLTQDDRLDPALLDVRADAVAVP